MKKGFKKFLAMVSIVGLTSGVGALSCAADDKLIAGNQVVYYQTLAGKTLSEDQKKLFDKVKLDNAEYFKVKAGLSEDQKKLLDEALKLFNPFVVIEKSKVGSGSSETESAKTGVSGLVVVAISTVVAVVSAVVGFFASKVLPNNQEGNA